MGAEGEAAAVTRRARELARREEDIEGWRTRPRGAAVIAAHVLVVEHAREPPMSEVPSQKFAVAALLKRDQLGRVERIDVFDAMGATGSTGATGATGSIAAIGSIDSVGATSARASSKGLATSAVRARGEPLLAGAGVPVAIRRVACGSSLWLSGVVARRLMARERAALRALEGLACVPQVDERAPLVALASLDGTIPSARDVLVRSWIAGVPLHEATELPRDFFDHLDALVHAIHARGVCHNDLHKEQNVLVGADGRPCLVDFQLASVHRTRERVFATRAREDLRHVEKHRRRYTRWGRGPDGAHAPQQGAGAEYRRSTLALAWRRTGKPLYNVITRSILRTKDGEPRRPSSGPWPRWSEPLGPVSTSKAFGR